MTCLCFTPMSNLLVNPVGSTLKIYPESSIPPLTCDNYSSPSQIKSRLIPAMAASLMHLGLSLPLSRLISTLAAGILPKHKLCNLTEN